MATVIGTFSSKDAAERAVSRLKEKGFSEKEISIVAKGGEKGRGNQREEQASEDFVTGGAGENVADGTAWGGTLGGIAGLLAGAGALAIPGIGPIVAAGPLAATLSGALAGGVAGGLLDLGIPEERGRYYESEIKRGKILAVVETDDDKVQEAAGVFREFGANDVESH